MEDLDEIRQQKQLAKEKEFDQVKIAYSNLLHDVLSFHELLAKKDTVYDMLTLVLRIAKTILDFESGVIISYEGKEFNVIHTINETDTLKMYVELSILDNIYSNIFENNHIELHC